MHGAVGLGRAREGALDLLGVADVELLHERAAGLRRRRVQRVDAAREQAQARTLAREPERDRLADPASRAGDDDVTTLEPCHAGEPNDGCTAAKLSPSRAHSSAGERSLHTREVPGSIPGAPTEPGSRRTAEASCILTFDDK